MAADVQVHPPVREARRVRDRDGGNPERRAHAGRGRGREKLREGLESAALARALTPNGAYTDNYLRAAMKRLGEVSPDGLIRMRDGSRFRGSVPIELMAAASQPHEALGYLALLRRFVALLEPGSEIPSTLQGLIAPELSPDRFRGVFDEGTRRERSCGGSADVAATP